MGTDAWLGISMVAMAILGGLVSAHAPSKRNHKLAYVAGFLLFGAVSVLFLVRLSKESATTTASLSSTLTQLQTATSEMQRGQQVITTLQARIVEQSKEITTLAQRNIDTLTGGDSFCYLLLPPLSGVDGPVLLHHGRFPIYDLEVRITNGTHLAELRQAGTTPTFDELMGTSIRIPEVQVGMGQINIGLQVPSINSDMRTFIITFNARNGSWTQILKQARTNGGKWVGATRVLRQTSDFGHRKLVLESIDPDFPRDQSGKVNWE